MNYLDLFFIIFLALGLIQGLRHGFIKEIAYIVAIVLGIYGSILVSPQISSWVVDTLQFQPDVALLVTYAALFIVVALLVHLVANIISKLLETIGLSWLNRILGMVVGFGKYLLICSLVLYGLNMSNDYTKVKQTKVVKTSQLYEPIAQVISYVLPFVERIKH